jgi:hypothetical protein
MKRSNLQRRCQVSLEYPLICELRKVCGKLEMETGVHISLSYLAKGIMVDFLTALRELPPNEELQELIYSTLGGYRPTQREFFLPMPTNHTSETGEQECHSHPNKESDEGDTSVPPMLPQSSD